MKIADITLLVFIFTSFAHAADTNSGRSFQPKATGKTTSFTYAITPFDISAEKLPVKYEGHSVLDIYKKLTPPKPRGEFEKTEEYENRVVKWKNTAILGNITPSDTLAFQLTEFLAPDAFSLKYDADKEEMTATISFDNHYFGSDKARWLETFYRSKNLGSYVGVTRMGVKFRVASYAGTSIGLAVNEQIAPISISKVLSRDQAIRMKSAIKAYAIVNIVAPYRVDESTSSTASLDSPSEWHRNYWGLWANLRAIWLVDWSTGEVIAKSEAPFTKCKYGYC